MTTLERECRKKGIPLTIQRRTVMEVLADNRTHPTAEHVYESASARIPGLSKATVYRVLEMFVSLGLISKVDHPGAATRYDPMQEEHHHFYCVDCERLIDIEVGAVPALPEIDLRESGHTIQDYSIHFRGVCEDCAGHNERKARI